MVGRPWSQQPWPHAAKGSVMPAFVEIGLPPGRRRLGTRRYVWPCCLLLMEAPPALGELALTEFAVLTTGSLLVLRGDGVLQAAARRRCTDRADHLR